MGASFRAVPYFKDAGRPSEFVRTFLKAPLMSRRVTRAALLRRASLEEPPDGYWALDPHEWEAVAEALLPTDWIRNRVGRPTLFPDG
jgi:hypothetical protein